MQADIARGLVAVMEAAVGAGDNDPYLPTSLSAVAVVGQLTYVMGNTYPEDRDSYWNMNLGYRNMLDREESCCCRTSEIRIQEVHYWRARSEKASLVRWTMMRSCRTSVNYRLKWTKIQGNQVNQPGVTKYRMSMPVAAVAKAEKAAYHSHTAVVEGRDD